MRTGREIEKAFRWYAMPGEAGLLMCTWPKGGALDAIPGKGLRPVENPEVWTGSGGYFNECTNGFEYQVAAHMVYEGEPGDSLVEKGLAIAKAVHESYGAEKRNPYNEIEWHTSGMDSRCAYSLDVPGKTRKRGWQKAPGNWGHPVVQPLNGKRQCLHDVRCLSFSFLDNLLQPDYTL